jgi:hypothetical protein
MLDQVVDCGDGKKSTNRRELEMGAQMGDPESIEKLEGPEPPDSVRYLLDWADDLASGLPDGFSWKEATAWAEAKDLHPLPHEYDAVRTLIHLMRYPSAEEDE